MVKIEEIQKKCYICDKEIDDLVTHFITSHNNFDRITVYENNEGEEEEIIEIIDDSDNEIVETEMEHEKDVNIEKEVKNDEQEYSVEKIVDKQTDINGKWETEEGSKEVKVKLVSNRKCDLCGKKFSTQEYIENHMRKFHKDSVHFGHRNHKFDSCGKSFIQSSSLKTHIDTKHLGSNKNYKCGRCEKSFAEAQNLKKHAF